MSSVSCRQVHMRKHILSLNLQTTLSYFCIIQQAEKMEASETEVMMTPNHFTAWKCVFCLHRMADSEVPLLSSVENMKRRGNRL